MGRLWYCQPANVWEEALPLGNGLMGAMVFGGVEKERIQGFSWIIRLLHSIPEVLALQILCVPEVHQMILIPGQGREYRCWWQSIRRIHHPM